MRKKKPETKKEDSAAKELKEKKKARKWSASPLVKKYITHEMQSGGTAIDDYKKQKKVFKKMKKGEITNGCDPTLNAT